MRQDVVGYHRFGWWWWWWEANDHQKSCSTHQPTTKTMWTALPDDLLMRLAELAPLRALVVLRKLERRCGRNVVVKERLDAVSRLVRFPFLFTWKGICERLYVNLSDSVRFGSVLSREDLEDFSKAIVNGAMPQLQSLFLDNNNIGDAGIIALSDSLPRRAMANVTVLNLNGNQIEAPGMASLLHAIARGAMAGLLDLRLAGNRIGDDGMKALSSALARGALPQLRVLVLNHNKIGDAGCSALAEAAAMGAMARLEDLYIGSNRFRDAAKETLKSACRVQGIKVWRFHRQPL